jgi:membrane-associated phospholipid phosphatase
MARSARGARLRLTLAAGFALALPSPAAAQRIEPSEGRFWVGAAATFAAAAVLDGPLRDALHVPGGGSPGGAAVVGDALGTARHAVPALALSYVAARAPPREEWASATLHVAAGYVAADLVESALKPVVGRERPHVSGHPYRFHPFTTEGDFHSFPSAHVTHAAALAGGIAEYAGRRRWVAPLCYAAVGLVGWDRVRADQHWTSDVVAGATIGVVGSKTVVRWLERRGAGEPGGGAAARRGLLLVPAVTPVGVGLAPVVSR